MRVLPDAASYILFDLAGETAGSACVVGTLLRPVLVPLRGEVDRVGITLRPGVAHLLFGMSARDVRNRVVGLSDVCARFRPSLLDALSSALDFRARVRVVEDWLLGELQRLTPSRLAMHSETNRLFHAVDRGAGPRTLMERTGWNERRIQRLFLTRFGASAATLRRVRRFRRSLAVLEAQDRPSRARVAADLGYSDQAHMCREFRDFAGTDIGSLLSERQRVGNVQAAGQLAVGYGRRMEIEYRENRSRGTFRAPDTAGPHPAVVALGGSDGGTPLYFADLLVPEGVACLSLAYWATPETQPWFTDIPLERIERGVRWLLGRPEIRTQEGRVALVGASRGRLHAQPRPSDTQVPDMLTDYGGSPEENAAAHADAWPEVLRCLRGSR